MLCRWIERDGNWRQVEASLRLDVVRDGDTRDGTSATETKACGNSIQVRRGRITHADGSATRHGQGTADTCVSGMSKGLKIY